MSDYVTDNELYELSRGYKRTKPEDWEVEAATALAERLSKASQGSKPVPAMKIWQERWWLIALGFAAGEVFEVLWITNDPLRTCTFAITNILLGLPVWGLWWVMKNVEVRRRK